MDEISSLLKAENPNTKNILDIGCGTGNYLIGLAKRGYQVDGIDSSQAMVEVAKLKINEANIPSKIILEDMADYSFEMTYDAAICLFGSFILQVHFWECCPEGFKVTFLPFKDHRLGLIFFEICNIDEI